MNELIWHPKPKTALDPDVVRKIVGFCYQDYMKSQNGRAQSEPVVKTYRLISTIK
jgi:hypothetical protein